MPCEESGIGHRWPDACMAISDNRAIARKPLPVKVET
jgi:hypothetical protein